MNLPEPYPKPAKTNRSPLQHTWGHIWERHQAGNFSLDSGQLLQGIYTFCRKKILYGLCPKLHFQNACPKLHKRSELRSYGGTYRKQLLCSFTFELKKKKNTGTQLYLCDEYGNSLQKNNFLVGHEISFVFIVTTAEISNVDSNSRIQWWFCMERRRDRKTNTKTQKHRGEFFFSSVSFRRKCLQNMTKSSVIQPISLF